MQRFFFYTLLFCLTTACAVDYNLKSTDVDELNRLVVNSFLNPEKPMCVYFYTIDRTDTGFVCNKAENLHVKLTEDEQVLFDGLCADTMLVLNHYPRANARYRIDVSLTGYEPVWAETTVPSAITCKARVERIVQPDDTTYYGDTYVIIPGNDSERKCFLSGFEGEYQRENTSLYLLFYSVLEGDSLVQSQGMYASNVLLDPINRTNGIEAKDKDIGSSYYDYFMRVKNRNIPYLDNLIFIPDIRPYGYYDYTDDGWFPVWVSIEVKNYLVKLITAGPEYDTYHRTFFQYTNYIVNDDDVSAFVFQPIQVYSNVNGGLGIFAGMNETNCYLKTPQKP